MGTNYPVSLAHPIADLLPWMTDEEVTELAADIGSHGQQEPIVRLPNGRIVDGRNRELACRVAGVEPNYEQRDLTEEQILDLVESANLHRRHLTQSQRAMVAAQLANMRQGERTDLVPRGTRLSPTTSQTQAATVCNVSRESVNRAARVAKEAPELVGPIRDGKLDVYTAARAAKLPEQDRQAIAAAPDPKVEATRRLPPERPERNGKAHTQNDPADFPPSASPAPKPALPADNWRDLDACGDDFGRLVNPAQWPDISDTLAQRGVKTVGDVANGLSESETFGLGEDALTALLDAVFKASGAMNGKPEGAGEARPLPPWFRPGGHPIDPDHPFKQLLDSMTSLAAQFTKAINTPEGQRLKQYLTQAKCVSHRDLIVNGKHYGAQFTGFRMIRRLLYLSGLPEKARTRAELEELIKAIEDEDQAA